MKCSVRRYSCGCSAVQSHLRQLKGSLFSSSLTDLQNPHYLLLKSAVSAITESYTNALPLLRLANLAAS